MCCAHVGLPKNVNGSTRKDIHIIFIHPSTSIINYFTIIFWSVSFCTCFNSFNASMQLVSNADLFFFLRNDMFIYSFMVTNLIISLLMSYKFVYCIYCSRVIEGCQCKAIVVPVLGNNVGVALRNHDISWEDFISRTAGLSRYVNRALLRL